MNKTTELLDATISRLKDNLVIKNDSKCVANQEKLDAYVRGDLPSVARLRLDWELSDDAQDDSDSIAELMMDHLRLDLLDLLENGDMGEISDPLLKVLDGVRKRGVEPNDIDIFEAVLYTEYRPRKESTEYTLYLLMHVDWPK